MLGEARAAAANAEDAASLRWRGDGGSGKRAEEAKPSQFVLFARQLPPARHGGGELQSTHCGAANARGTSFGGEQMVLHGARPQREAAVGMVVECPQRVPQLPPHDSTAQLNRHFIEHRGGGNWPLLLWPLPVWRGRQPTLSRLCSIHAVAWFRGQAHRRRPRPMGQARRCRPWYRVYRRVRRVVRREWGDALPKVPHFFASPRVRALHEMPPYNVDGCLGPLAGVR